MSKSYVGMGVEVCPVCHKEHDETVLLDKRMKDTFTEGKKTCTGFSLCPEHKAMAGEYLAFVEIANDATDADKLRPQDVNLTGRVAHIRREALPNIMKEVPPADLELVWVGKEVMDNLEEMATHTEEAANDAVAES